MGFKEDYSAYKQLERKNGIDSPSVMSTFADLAKKYFGKADFETLRKRADFAERGFAVVNYDGMTHEQALRILDSKETLAILVGGAW